MLLAADLWLLQMSHVAVLPLAPLLSSVLQVIYNVLKQASNSYSCNIW